MNRIGSVPGGCLSLSIAESSTFRNVAMAVMGLLSFVDCFPNKPTRFKSSWQRTLFFGLALVKNGCFCSWCHHQHCSLQWMGFGERVRETQCTVRVRMKFCNHFWTWVFCPSTVVDFVFAWSSTWHCCISFEMIWSVMEISKIQSRAPLLSHSMAIVVSGLLFHWVSEDTILWTTVKKVQCWNKFSWDKWWIFWISSCHFCTKHGLHSSIKQSLAKSQKRLIWCWADSWVILCCFSFKPSRETRPAPQIPLPKCDGESLVFWFSCFCVQNNPVQPGNMHSACVTCLNHWKPKFRCNCCTWKHMSQCDMLKTLFLKLCTTSSLGFLPLCIFVKGTVCVDSAHMHRETQLVGVLIDVTCAPKQILSGEFSHLQTKTCRLTPHYTQFLCTSMMQLLIDPNSFQLAVVNSDTPWETNKQKWQCNHQWCCVLVVCLSFVGPTVVLEVQHERNHLGQNWATRLINMFGLLSSTISINQLLERQIFTTWRAVLERPIKILILRFFRQKSFLLSINLYQNWNSTKNLIWNFYWGFLGRTGLRNCTIETSDWIPMRDWHFRTSHFEFWNVVVRKWISSQSLWLVRKGLKITPILRAQQFPTSCLRNRILLVLFVNPTRVQN